MQFPADSAFLPLFLSWTQSVLQIWKRGSRWVSQPVRGSHSSDPDSTAISCLGKTQHPIFRLFCTTLTWSAAQKQHQPLIAGKKQCEVLAEPLATPPSAFVRCGTVHVSPSAPSFLEVIRQCHFHSNRCSCAVLSSAAPRFWPCTWVHVPILVPPSLNQQTLRPLPRRCRRPRLSLESQRLLSKWPRQTP